LDFSGIRFGDFIKSMKLPGGEKTGKKWALDTEMRLSARPHLPAQISPRQSSPSGSLGCAHGLPRRKKIRQSAGKYYLD
jgi:hypothetical protein